jgi:urease accessory protein
MLTTTTEHLTRLMAWLSPTFPVGGYTYSHGIEYAVESGHVLNRADLVRWVEAILKHGAGRTDAVLFAAAYRAVKAADEPALIWAAERADVLRGSSELALESTAQGTAFLSTVGNTWAPEDLRRWADVLGATGRPPAHAIAVAVVTACAGIPLEMALSGFLHAFAANLVSAGVRLVPLGQTDGQRAIAELDPIIHHAASRALAARLDDLGGCAPMIDWAAMSHETQYTRLFRS